MFETPETFGKFVIKEQCLSCTGSGKRPPQGGLKGGSYCRRCNGVGYITTEWNVHVFEGGDRRGCFICGLDEADGVHELQQSRLI